MKKPIIAVDFDGCLCENKFPRIGAANTAAIAKLRQRRREGAKLILWTCRTGTQLREALDFCELYGLRFDAVNDNLPEIIEKFAGFGLRTMPGDAKVAADFVAGEAARYKRIIEVTGIKRE